MLPHMHGQIKILKDKRNKRVGYSSSHVQCWHWPLTLLLRILESTRDYVGYWERVKVS